MNWKRRLTAVGLGSVWLGMGLGSSPGPVAPKDASTVVVRATLPALTAVAGEATPETITVETPLGPKTPTGTMHLTINGAPVAVTVAARQRQHDRWVTLRFQAPATLAPGRDPASLTWVTGATVRQYQGFVTVPALFLAEQSGIFEDNALGHAVPLAPGAFRQATEPTGMAYDAQNQRLYVADANAGAVFVYNTRGRLLQTLNPPPLLEPTYLAVVPGWNRLFVYQDGGTANQMGFMALTLAGKVVPWPGHATFPQVFALGNAVTVDPSAHLLFVSRSLTGSQAASGAAAVVAYNANTGRAVPTAEAFPGAGANPTDVLYVGADNTVYVSGYANGPDQGHYVRGFRPNGTPDTASEAFPIGETSTGHAQAIVYNPLTRQLWVIGDAYLHRFTLAGTPVPPLTSRSDSGVPLAQLKSGLVAAALAY
ncbi:MAG: hypothetical protein OWU84_05155 [Firmicutes bacterium]|nr:hypothetical protein [Bacillota bacterium]